MKQTRPGDAHPGVLEKERRVAPLRNSSIQVNKSSWGHLPLSCPPGWGGGGELARGDQFPTRASVDMCLPFCTLLSHFLERSPSAALGSDCTSWGPCFQSDHSKHGFHIQGRNHPTVWGTCDNRKSVGLIFINTEAWYSNRVITGPGGGRLFPALLIPPLTARIILRSFVFDQPHMFSAFLPG